MKIVILVTGLLLSIASAHLLADGIPDTPGNRQAAAERYLSVVSMESMMKDMIDKTAANLPASQRDEYKAFMTKHVNTAVLERAALASMVRHFTVRELDALTEFYGSPEGRSVMKKFGAYMADITPVLQQEMRRAIQEYSATQ